MQIQSIENINQSLHLYGKSNRIKFELAINFLSPCMHQNKQHQAVAAAIRSAVDAALSCENRLSNLLQWTRWILNAVAKRETGTVQYRGRNILLVYISRSMLELCIFNWFFE